jgi:hypothetical protein
MMHWLLSPFESGLTAMLSAALGFGGAFVLVQATWRTIDLRKQIIDTALISGSDQDIQKAAGVVQVELQRAQLKDLNNEHRAYFVGVTILFVGFAVQFLHEFAVYMRPAGH